LDVMPILSLDSEGKVVPLERVRGRENVEARVLALLEQRLTPRPRVVRFGVAHADAPDVAQRIRAALVDRYQPRDCLVTLATGVLGTHVGPGAWGVFYQVEDEVPSAKRGSKEG
jgi:fatty acid-binding protein DegV